MIIKSANVDKGGGKTLIHTIWMKRCVFLTPPLGFTKAKEDKLQLFSERTILPCVVILFLATYVVVSILFYMEELQPPVHICRQKIQSCLNVYVMPLVFLHSLCQCFYLVLHGGASAPCLAHICRQKNKLCLLFYQS